MRIDKRSLDLYRGRVNAQANKARAFTRKSLEAYFAANPGATTAEARAFCIELLKASMPNFCDAAGTLAVDFFDEVCDAEGLDAKGELYDTTDWDIIEDKVRYFAGKLNDGDEEGFKKQVIDATHYFVKRSAYDNMRRNCDANDVKYARVPSGFETCAFCFMLASRGFVYDSEAKAGGFGHGYHNHCDCCVVPGKAGRTKIEGYDPQGMYDRLKSCEETIGGRKAIEAAWKNLPEEERQKWIDRHRTKEGRPDPTRARAAFTNSLVMRELETRDWGWLYTGEPPEQHYWKPREEFAIEDEDGNIIEKFRDWRDLFAHDALRANGIEINVRAENAPKGYSNIDLDIDGKLWEVKSPDGDGKTQAKNQFKVAKDQFARQYRTSDPVRVIYNGKYSLKPDVEITKDIKKRMITVGGIKEVLQVMKDGSILRIKSEQLGGHT